MKQGDTVTMLFHMAGLTSEEEYKVRNITEYVVTLDTDEDLGKCHRFHLTQGFCYDDNNDSSLPINVHVRRELKL